MDDEKVTETIEATPAIEEVETVDQPIAEPIVETETLAEAPIEVKEAEIVVLQSE